MAKKPKAAEAGAESVTITFIRNHEIQDEHRGTDKATWHRKGDTLQCSKASAIHFVESLAVAVYGAPKPEETSGPTPGAVAVPTLVAGSDTLFEFPDGSRAHFPHAGAAQEAWDAAHPPAPEKTGPDDGPGSPPAPPAGEYPQATGGGWYVLSNGSRVQGEQAARDAQAQLDAATETE